MEPSVLPRHFVARNRDLGIDLAGVELILRYRDEMDLTRGRLDRLARSPRQALEARGGPDGRS